MDCERPGCGHPLNLHDPCAAKGCRCRAYEPTDRKQRVALLTDHRLRPVKIKDAREAEARLRGIER